MKRIFEYAGKSYKVRKDQGERLTHTDTDILTRRLLNSDGTFITTGDTIVVVSGDDVYIATIRETIDMRQK